MLVKKDTLKLLERAKKVLGMKTYDEVIRLAVEKLFDVPDDMFGVDKGKISEFKEEDRLLMNEGGWQLSLIYEIRLCAFFW